MFCDDCKRNPDCHAIWKTHGDQATNCVCWTPKRTNADRIRNMTDEELAKKMSGLESFAPTCGDGWPPEKWLEWLKQEAEGCE